MTTLLMSSRHSADSQSLWRAAIARGWSVERAKGLRLPDFDDHDVVLYVEALFAAEIAKAIGRRLLDPPVDWLVNLPVSLTNRKIEMRTLGQARQLEVPTFVKPPNDKSFTAKVYRNGQELSDAFDDEISVLLATPVEWEAEFRCFCLDGRVVTHSPYLRHGEFAKDSNFQITQDESERAIATAEDALARGDLGLPRAIVVDVGIIKGKGWSVVEANGAWGAGIYGCNPELVLDVIRQATIPVLAS